MEDDLTKYSKEELIEHIKILNHNIDIDEEDKRKNYISKDKIRKKLEKIEELYDEKAKAENFEYNNNQFIVDFVALVEELLEV